MDVFSNASGLIGRKKELESLYLKGKDCEGRLIDGVTVRWKARTERRIHAFGYPWPDLLSALDVRQHECPAASASDTLVLSKDAKNPMLNP